jgi:general secretion pathway protein M
VKLLDRLSERDRRTVIIGAVVIGVALAWALLWDPLTQSRTRLAADVDRLNADLAFMREAAPAIRARSGAGNPSALERAGRSLLALTDGTAREAGLGFQLKRVEPVGEGRVSVWFEGVAFDGLVGWLDGIGSRFGVRVEDLRIERSIAAGTVDARITLRDTGR